LRALRPHEVEDCLCIFKEQIARGCCLTFRFGQSWMQYASAFIATQERHLSVSGPCIGFQKCSSDA
jgi:hypothetical protein